MEKSTEKTEGVIGKTEEDIGKIEKVIGKTEEVIGKTEEVIGKTEEDIGKIEKVIGKTEEVIGKTEEDIGKIEKVFGKTEEVIGKTEEDMGKTEEVIGNTEEAIGKTEGTTDKSEGMTDKSEEITDKSEGITSNIEEATNNMIGDIASSNVDIPNSSILSLTSKLGDEYIEDDQEENNDSEEGDEETTDEEEVETEMTSEEKKAMYEAVKNGDFDALEDCLDKPNSDINIVWYKENLLMTAIRHGQEEMAAFLLDIGVDHTYSTSVVELRETPSGIMLDKYDLTCRQMAYDHGLLDIVQLIDSLEGNLFPFVHPPERTPRQRRQRQTTPSEFDDSCDGDDDSSISPSDHDNDKGDNSEIMSDDEGVNKNEKKKREKKDDDSKNESYSNKEDDDKTALELDDVPNDNQSKDESGGVRRTRKKKTNSVNSNNEVECQIETEQTKETVKSVGTESRYRSIGSMSLSVARLPQQGELNKNQDVKPSNENQYQKTFPEKNIQSRILQKKTVGNESLIKDIDHTEQTLEDAPSTFINEMTPSWLTQPRNRIWSSKSALALRNVNSRQPNNYLHKNDQSRPLQWKKVSTLGSYTSESKYWHEHKEIQLTSPLEYTDTTLNHLLLPSIKSSKSYSPLCAKLQRQATCSVCSTKRNDSSITRSSNSHISSTTMTSIHADKVQPTKYKTTKIKINQPRFLNSYEVLDFIPDVRAH